jgi:hypothetical protein
MTDGQEKHGDGNSPGGASRPEFAILDSRIRHVLSEMGIPPQQSGVDGGCGFGSVGGPGVDTRMAQLEVHTAYIKRDASELRSDAKEARASINSIEKQLAALSRHVARLPNEKFIAKALCGALAVIVVFRVHKWNIMTRFPSSIGWARFLRKSARVLPSHFSEVEYLCANPDVARALHRGIFKSGGEHWLKHGQHEQRPFRP